MARQRDDDQHDRTPLSRERAVLAAVELADESGLGALTMRNLSDRLGFEVMSLYNHVANKEDLLDGMVDFVFSEIDPPPTTAHWRMAMRHRAISVREVLARHPWATGLMESRSTPGPANLQHHNAVLGYLMEAGFSIALAVHAYWLMDSYIFGFALQEASLPFGSSDELTPLIRDILHEMPPGQYPYLTEVGIELSAGYDPADEFEFGLDLILDALDRLHTN